MQHGNTHLHIPSWGADLEVGPLYRDHRQRALTQHVRREEHETKNGCDRHHDCSDEGVRGESRKEGDQLGGQKLARVDSSCTGWSRLRSEPTYQSRSCMKAPHRHSRNQRENVESQLEGQHDVVELRSSTGGSSQSAWMACCMAHCMAHCARVRVGGSLPQQGFSQFEMHGKCWLQAMRVVEWSEAPRKNSHEDPHDSKAEDSGGN